MTQPTIFEVAEHEDGERLDAFLATHVSGISRTVAATLVRDGKALVNGARVKPSHRLRSSDRVEALVEVPPSLTAAPEAIALNVLDQDADMAVIDKPAGMVVHPSAGHEGGTLANALTARFPEARDVGEEARPGIVHRLDKDTSGLIAVALSHAGMQSLQRQIASREADRRYLALVTGHMDSPGGTIEAPIGRDPGHRKRMAPHGVAARPARTSYRVLETLDGFDLVEVRLHTGRTHQIRVHFAAIRHPLAGDRLYHGQALPDLERQFLHAHSLRIRRPSDDEPLSFSSPLPRDLQSVLERLRVST